MCRYANNAKKSGKAYLITLNTWPRVGLHVNPLNANVFYLSY